MLTPETIKLVPLECCLTLLILVFEERLQIRAVDEVGLFASSNGLETALHPPSNRLFVDTEYACQLRNGIAHMFMYPFGIDFAHMQRRDLRAPSSG